jgi:hypothetical protein
MKSNGGSLICINLRLGISTSSFGFGFWSRKRLRFLLLNLLISCLFILAEFLPELGLGLSYPLLIDLSINLSSLMLAGHVELLLLPFGVYVHHLSLVIQVHPELTTDSAAPKEWLASWIKEIEMDIVSVLAESSAGHFAAEI